MRSCSRFCPNCGIPLRKEYISRRNQEICTQCVLDAGPDMTICVGTFKAEIYTHILGKTRTARLLRSVKQLYLQTNDQKTLDTNG